MRAIFCFLLFPFLLSAQSKALKITHLSDNFYVYTTYQLYQGKAVPSNSLYVLSDAGAVLIDSPWDTTQCQPLLDSIQARHGKKVVFCVATHFHEDRTGGLDFLKRKGIPTWSSCQTLELCQKERMPQAANCFLRDTAFQIGDLRFETFYPGAGHAPDNIVVWFPREKLLFGGCFVKSTENQGLGNLSNADLRAWPISVKKARRQFRDARLIIPGHYGWEGDGLKHTLRLLRRSSKSKQ